MFPGMRIAPSQPQPRPPSNKFMRFCYDVYHDQLQWYFF